MRVLFVTSRGHDCMSQFLYDGFCDLAGEQDVVCADDYPFLRWVDGATGRLLRRRSGRPTTLHFPDGTSNLALFGTCDLAVVNACFARDHDWDWLRKLFDACLAPNGVVAYVEGWDAATAEVFPPPPGVPVHRVFRREVESGYPYPYEAVPLQWACPAWWLDEPRPQKTVDVSCLCSVSGVPGRWEVMSQVFRTRTRFSAVVGSDVPFEQYLEVTRRSKLVVVPPGGGSDCIRQWEAIGCGAIPVFVGHPPRVRDPWFADDEIFSCSVEGLPETLDRALASDLPARAAKLTEHARREHTTRARAEKVVQLTGVVA